MERIGSSERDAPLVFPAHGLHSDMGDLDGVGAAVSEAQEDDLAWFGGLIPKRIVVAVFQDRGDSGIGLDLQAGSGAAPTGELDAERSAGNERRIDRDDRRRLHLA